MIIGSNGRSWSLDVPFDHFGQKHPTGSCEIGQNSQIYRFSRLKLVRARTFERKVKETWLYAQIKGLCPYICIFTISVKKTLPDFVKLPLVAAKMLAQANVQILKSS